MTLALIDRIVTGVINAIREEKGALIELILSGGSPNEEYYKNTGYLRGLSDAEEKVRIVAMQILKEENLDES